MLRARRVLTAREIEARRRNAQKSTGPRTERGKRRSSLNAFKGGVIRRWPLETMLALEESPEDYQRLLDGLLEAYQPAHRGERVLVEEIASLHLRRERNQQAQDGLILKNLGKLQRERYRRQQEITHGDSNFPHREAQEVGLVNIDDCPAKFKEISRLLDIMREEVDQGVFSEEGGQLLGKIFGPNPSMRAAKILGFYNHCWTCGRRFRAPDKDPETRGPSVEVVGVQATKPADPVPFDEDTYFDESVYADLRIALAEERLLTGDKYERYLKECVRSVREIRAEALTPSDDAWGQLIRQEQLIDQQIERKTRLLLFTQWVRRSEGLEQDGYNPLEKTKLGSGLESKG